jgi:hypothetical protein
MAAMSFANLNPAKQLLIVTTPIHAQKTHAFLMNV